VQNYEVTQNVAIAALLASSQPGSVRSENPVMTVNVPWPYGDGVSGPRALCGLASSRGQALKLPTFGHDGTSYVKVTQRELRGTSSSLLIFVIEATDTVKPDQEKAET